LPQVLLIHASALAAHHLETLLTALEQRGYSRVSLEQAMRHAAYDRPTQGYTGSGGVTWLHRWAITEGLDSRIFADEPRPSDWVVEESAGDGRAQAGDTRSAADSQPCSFGSTRW
jgi:hypothetical protein